MRLLEALENISEKPLIIVFVRLIVRFLPQIHLFWFIQGIQNLPWLLFIWSCSSSVVSNRDSHLLHFLCVNVWWIDNWNAGKPWKSHISHWTRSQCTLAKWSITPEETKSNYNYTFETYNRPQNLKKSRPKKLVKSIKSISRKKFLKQIPFFAISKMAKNQFLTEKSLKLKIFHEN